MFTAKKIAKIPLLVCLIWVFFSENSFAGIPIQHWRQSGGAAVYLVESHSIPMVDVQIDFDAGTRRDSAGQAGLAAATAGMMGKGIAAQGGQPALDENALSEAWVDLGASFSTVASADRMTFQLRSLTESDVLNRAATLGGRQLAYPAFDGQVWQRERARLDAAWKEAENRPATVAARAFVPAVYGVHPYGFEVTPTSLGRIEPDHMRAFAQRHLQACRARVSIVGDLGRAAAEALVAQLLGPLAAQNPDCAALPAVPDVPALTQAAAIELPVASAQAHLLLGQPGMSRSDRDYFALIVGNHILGGGGFVSRLTAEVREKRGLSYSVYSYFNPGMHAGAFTIGLQTRADQASQALAVAQRVLREFVSNGPTEAELRAAKDQLVGGFALRIDSNRKLLDNVANIAWYGLPLDYLETWTTKVEALTVTEIRDAFQRHIHPDTLVTVVVGARP